MINPDLKLIYCGGGGSPLTAIAMEHGWLPGRRSDDSYRGRMRGVTPYMLDWNFHHPDWEPHLRQVQMHSPHLAVAPDIYSPDDIDILRSQVASLAQYSQSVIVVPKCSGVADVVMQWDKVILGYSVPTRYGSAGSLSLKEFKQYPVHLLGGSAKKQYELCRELNVVSLDCKSFSLAASYGMYVTPDLNYIPKSSVTPAYPGKMYDIFRISCQNIYNKFKGITNDNQKSQQLRLF